MTSRRIDWELAARHLAMLDRPGIPHLIAIIPEAPGVKGGAVRHLLGTLSAIADALDQAQSAGAGVFVTVNGMRGRRRLKSELTRIRAVWCERDQPGRNLPLLPSLRVRTSPGRGHDYLITGPADERSRLDQPRRRRSIRWRCPSLRRSPRAQAGRIMAPEARTIPG